MEEIDGYNYYEECEVCPMCDGEGTIKSSRHMMDDMCPLCKGEGDVVKTNPTENKLNELN